VVQPFHYEDQYSHLSHLTRRICDEAFVASLQCPIRLHDGIESIGKGAFAYCIFTNFRVPPLITVIPHFMLVGCKSMFSVELPDNIMEIKNGALRICYCLRNVAIPPNAVIGNDIFLCEEDDKEIHTDLLQLFGSKERTVRELQHRFDRLPIHFIVYYKSYYQGVLQNLIAAINLRSGQRRTLRSKLDPTGNQQDCLGMTPLHILACSSVHDLELYHVIVEKYPTNLITEDRWGALPLLYAIWGAAPNAIIEFLLESYQSLYPRYEFNWTMMVETMGRTHTPKEQIENLLCMKQMHFPEQPIDWEYLLNKIAHPSKFYLSAVLFEEQMRFLVMSGMSMRVEALPFKFWRKFITIMIHISNFKFNGEESQNILRAIRDKLTHFEDELPNLKETATMLELALWKKRIHDMNHQDVATRSQKKIKTVESSTRQQDRVTCGADVVIGHVMPFLIEDIVWRAVNNDRDLGFCHHQASLPLLLNGEYDVTLPVTSSGLLLTVTRQLGGVAFVGYRRFPDGSKGPSEERQLLCKHGDIIIAVNGQSTVKKSFEDVILICRESKTFAYIRLSNQNALRS